ncbi:MAG: type I glyceraldehyde-3-phosphate dehydrogenase [Candidatus Bipolaricaulota bacterium]|nr:type I glyceraldehyde-3-phosphate dehydrogenase [Candidatus Bipolaricaulota bacterium]MBS3791480.1 type I glyceraldehyde-3-phosphate dehydrogenase [Candidatus Bipolaricaulota bacterium]
MVKVGINGFGRIGRAYFRIAESMPGIEIVAINDIQQDPKQAAYLLKYDSVYGRFDAEVDYNDDGLVVNGEDYPILSVNDPAELPWSDLGVDVALESTGVFRQYEDAEKHLTAGATKVLVSAPPKGDRKDEIPQIVWKINEGDYDENKHDIVAGASCTTNSVAPPVKLLQEEYGIESALFTTVHSYTSSQKIVDSPYAWKKASRGRAAAENIVPTTTGAATAVVEVIPEMEDKINGMAMRVPTPAGSVTDLVARLESDTTVEELNSKVKEYAEGEMKGALGYTNDPIVSRDILGPYSSYVGLTSTDVVNGNMVKLLAFYDNEWGYTSQIIDLTEYIV